MLLDSFWIIDTDLTDCCFGLLCSLRALRVFGTKLLLYLSSFGIGASKWKVDLVWIALSDGFSLLSLIVVGCDFSLRILSRMDSQRFSMCSAGGRICSILNPILFICLNRNKLEQSFLESISQWSSQLILLFNFSPKYLNSFVSFSGW